MLGLKLLKLCKTQGCACAVEPPVAEQVDRDVREPQQRNLKVKRVCKHAHSHADVEVLRHQVEQRPAPLRFPNQERQFALHVVAALPILGPSPTHHSIYVAQ